ncbi:MAG: hypothetical protein EBZ48_15230, partial [Proteobacteria bacterium]|nr:hypothetical protein [Pseudomonadota bacterium]
MKSHKLLPAVAFLAAGWLCQPALAAPPSARDKQGIHEAMVFNFDACNREHIEDVMKSCADAMPDREKFRRETLATFEEKDIHYSLVECEVLDVRVPWAKARIVQDTHVLDRESKDQDQAAFRNSSALLPSGARVEYINTFKKENGKWKLYLIISEMRPVK